MSIRVQPSCITSSQLENHTACVKLNMYFDVRRMRYKCSQSRERSETALIVAATGSRVFYSVRPVCACMLPK
jgi:hypothetical protein